MKPWEMMRRFGVAVDGDGDPLWPYVVSCVNSFGAHGSADWTDQRGHVWTPSSASAVTREDPDFPDGAIAFDGTNFLDAESSEDWTFGAGALCIEAFVKVTGPLSNRAIASFMSNWTFYVDSSDSRLDFYRGGGANLITGSVYPIGSRRHVAYCRDAAGMNRIFIGGSAAGAAAGWSGNVTSTNMRIGAATGGSPSSFLRGLVGPWRITSGHPRYIEPFIPPASFPAY